MIGENSREFADSNEMGNDTGRSILVVIGMAVIALVLICLLATIGFAIFNYSIVPTPVPIPLT